MPPRSKQCQRIVEWSACARCSCQFSNRDVELHNEVCLVDSPFNSEVISLKTLMYGFVKDNVLIAGLTLADGKDDSRLAVKDEKKTETAVVRESLLKQKNHRVIFVNPLTMSSCGLNILRPAVINNQHVFLAWPDSGLPLTTVAVSGAAARHILGVKPKQFLVVSAMKGDDLAAKEVHVRPRSDDVTTYGTEPTSNPSIMLASIERNFETSPLNRVQCWRSQMNATNQL